jgi:hypothetical protein
MVATPGFGGIADTGVEIGFAFRKRLEASIYMPAPTDKALM